MKQEVRFVDIGEGLEEAELVAWLVSIGEVVERDAPLVEVMTDKSNAELPAPCTGVVLEINGDVGDIVTVGDLLAVIEDGTGEPDQVDHLSRPAMQASTASAATLAESSATTPPDPAADRRVEAPTRPKASPATRRAAQRRGIDLADIVGSGPGGRILMADLDEIDNTDSASFTEPNNQLADTRAPTGEPSATTHPTGEPSATTHPTDKPSAITQPTDKPSATTQPTGEPSATTQPTDKPSATTHPTDKPSATTHPTDKPSATTEPNGGRGVPRGQQDDSTTDDSKQERIPLRGLRRAIARNMAQSWSDIPHIHVSCLVDALPLVELRDRLKLNGAEPFASITPITFFVAAVSRALARFPEANASLDFAAGTITRHSEINVGIAVASPKGLVVPVIGDAASLTLSELIVAIDRLVVSARTGKLEASDSPGGTATISNFGALGAEQATPLIRPPEAVIFGFGSIAKRPFVIDDRVVARSTLNIVVGADHRLLDGDTVSALLSDVVDSISDPLSLIIGS